MVRILFKTGLLYLSCVFFYSYASDLPKKHEFNSTPNRKNELTINYLLNPLPERIPASSQLYSPPASNSKTHHDKPPTILSYPLQEKLTFADSKDCRYLSIERKNKNNNNNHARGISKLTRKPQKKSLENKKKFSYFERLIPYNPQNILISQITTLEELSWPSSQGLMATDIYAYNSILGFSEFEKLDKFQILKHYFPKNPYQFPLRPCQRFSRKNDNIDANVKMQIQKHNLSLRSSRIIYSLGRINNPELREDLINGALFLLRVTNLSENNSEIKFLKNLKILSEEYNKDDFYALDQKIMYNKGKRGTATIHRIVRQRVDKLDLPDVNTIEEISTDFNESIPLQMFSHPDLITYNNLG